MDVKKATKLPFIINLMNYINILNCIYTISKENIFLFHRLLLFIKSKFTYVKRDDKTNIIDFCFLTNVSSLIIPHIISKRETSFDDKFLNDLAKTFCIIIRKTKTDLGYIFKESNQEYITNELDKDSFIEYPTIIYYLNSSFVQKLYKDKIFNLPQVYCLNDQKDNGEDYFGYNEFDICIKIKKDIKM